MPIDRIYLVEIDGYDPDTETVETYRFCTGPGYQSGPLWYEPRVIQPASLSRSISTSEFGGRQNVSYGECTLAAIDGGVDYLADRFFDGRELRLYFGMPSLSRESFVLILSAQIEAVAVEREQASIRLRDRAVTLEKPFSTVKYAGNNELPLGLEGGPDDIKDSLKPRIFGRVALMNPVQVNTAKLIYQMNDGYAFPVNIFDGGAYLTRQDPGYDDLTDLESEAGEPDAGSFRQYAPGGYFRLGASPVGQISASVAEDWRPQRISAAGLLRRVIEDAASRRPDSPQPQGPVDWDEIDLQTLDEQVAAPLGLVIDGEETTASVLDRICQSVGAWWGVSALGKLTVFRLQEPSATADFELTVSDMTIAERTPDGQNAVWRVTVQADRNYAVQDKSGLMAAATEARAAWLGNEYRDSTAEDETIQATRLLAEEQKQQSIMCSISQAKAEAERRLALHSVRRDITSIQLANPAFYFQIDLGKTVKIIAPRLGYQTGRNMVIIGMVVDYGANTADLTLWG